MKRDQSLDVLRGLLLVVMTIDHVGGPLKQFSFEPFGVFSAAEGFIYLSGLVYGLVYSKIFYNEGFSYIYIKSIKRARVIYLYHIISFFLILFINQMLSESIEITFNENRYNFFLKEPINAFVLFISLFYQPENFDILPLYIILIVISPLIIKMFSKGKFILIFIVSGTIYLLTQILHYTEISFFLINTEFKTGYLNLSSWQIIFIVGVYVGYLRYHNKLLLKRKKIFFFMAIIASIFFIFARNNIFEDSLLIKGIRHFSGRQYLEPSRLISFFCFVYIVDYLKSKKILFNSIFLSKIGRHSLQVFTFHLILINLISPLLFYFHPNSNSTFLLILQIVFSILLIIPAYFHEFAQKKFSFVKRFGF